MEYKHPRKLLTLKCEKTELMTLVFETPYACTTASLLTMLLNFELEELKEFPFIIICPQLHMDDMAQFIKFELSKARETIRAVTALPPVIVEQLKNVE